MYGTLQYKPILLRVLAAQGLEHCEGSVEHLRFSPGSLYGFKRLAVSNEAYPAIVADACGVVDGTIIEGLGSREMELLDRYEGEEYEKVSVSVSIAQHSNASNASNAGGSADPQVKCVVYVWCDDENRLVKGQTWTLDARTMEDFLEEI